jgi:predicted phosphodiesterase
VRYLIISDLHGNHQALRAVLEQAEGRYDRILCCGDIVGYGADPNAVTDWTRSNVAAVVRGNHDKACTGSEDLEWFNPVARISALWTHHVLRRDNFDYLSHLPKGPVIVDGFQILHGSPVDEDEYLVSVADARQVTSYLERSVSFFGHTHLQGGFIFSRGGGVRAIEQVPQDESESSVEIRPDDYYLINPGSVGQPRDEDPRAAYALYMPEEHHVLLGRVFYDIAGAQSKIREAGLPDVLARRLAIGA